MQRAGLIGDPVEHSLSPHMHNAAFRALGIDARYELWRTDTADVGQRVESLRDEDVLGANATVPHKQSVMPFLDYISEAARQIGAVNTIVRQPDGSLIGENTDEYGFRRSLDLAFPGSTAEQAVILGAGGASRAVIVALRQMGVGRIIIANRTAAKAEALAAEFGIQSTPWESVMADEFPDSGLLVNATSLGWHDELPIDASTLDALLASAIVVDLTYRATPFLRAAAERGRRTLDGLGMLIHQGARAFELWTGEPAPVDVMQEAVLSEQARRA